MKKVIFYHAGCPVCVSAEQQIVGLIDSSRYSLEIIHLGENKGKISQAEKLGVKSVPALYFEGNVLHLNYGASLNDVRG
jgi:glutaredoxin 3